MGSFRACQLSRVGNGCYRFKAVKAEGAGRSIPIDSPEKIIEKQEIHEAHAALQIA
jgi:hypothetical protein